MKVPTYLYHRTESPIVVDWHEVEQYLKQGWSDTPATFLTEEANYGQNANETTDESADQKTRKGRKRVLNDADSQ